MVSDMKKKIAITSDCVCDLPSEILEEYGVEVIHFYITTDYGCFKDMEEITSLNIVEYFENGGKHIATQAAQAREYEDLFKRVLEKYEEVIHITTTFTLSKSYENAIEASKMFHGKVHILDSGHISAGIGHLVLKAVKLVEEGKETKEIIEVLSSMKKRISTSFIVENADYLYKTGRVSKFVRDFCNVLKLHPVLHMRNGIMTVKKIKIGNYEKAALRYIRGQLKRVSRIDKERAFVAQCSCSVKLISKVKWAIKEECNFDELIVTKASATVSSNCGANAVGIIYLKNEKR